MILWIGLVIVAPIVAYFLWKLFSEKPAPEPIIAETKPQPRITIINRPNPTFQYGPVKIVYSSQTGTSENFAESIVEEAKEHLVNCETINLKDVDVFFAYQVRTTKERKVGDFCHRDSLRRRSA